MKNKFGQEIELLAPAGNTDRLRVALHFGADAVYLGGKEFGLRAKSSNFDEKELAAAVEYAHSLNRRIYVTVNIFAKNADFPAIKKYAAFLQKIKVDAVIISDPGVMKIFHETTDLEIHVSTQANITNKFAAMQYVELGARRLILARELPIADIAEIADYVHGRAVVEVFVHGAMCISYSGRCLLSNYLTGRESNRGDCSQPCRYSYTLIEGKRPNEFYPIEQDDRGTYILNSRDLCLIDRLQELADAGVASFKIEGRMKSEHYVGGVVNTYRRKMRGEKFDAVNELNKISHRPYTTGLAFGDKTTEFTKSPGQIQTHEIAAVVTEPSPADFITVQQKNKFAVGNEMEVLSPAAAFNKTFVVTEIDGTAVAGTPNAIYKIKCPFPLECGDILRKVCNVKDEEK